MTVPNVDAPVGAEPKAELAPNAEVVPNPEVVEGVAAAPNPDCEAPNPAPNPVAGLADPNAPGVLAPNCGVEAAVPNPPPNPGVLGVPVPKADPADCPKPAVGLPKIYHIPYKH